MQKTILHIDMDAYFASCAQLAYPQYKNKPIAIGGKSSKSIISTASYEARKYGVRSAMPVFMAKKLCPNLILLDVEFELYEKYTYAFIKIIERFTKNIEMASIDECYVDITDLVINNNYLEVASNIQNSIYNELGLTCSIGISTTKFLAKMASDLNKPFGISTLFKEEVEEKLYDLNIGKMYGIGKKSEARLQEIGINKIKDLVYEDSYKIIEVLGLEHFEHFINCLKGLSNDELNYEHEMLKSVGNSRTLHNPTTNYDEMRDMINKLSKMVSNRAKNDNLIGDGVSITIKYNDFKTQNKSKKLKDYTNDVNEIFMNAMQLFDDSFYVNRPIRLLGVTLTNVKEDINKSTQLSLFDIKEEKSIDSKTKDVIEAINLKIGKNIVMSAGNYKKDKENG